MAYQVTKIDNKNNKQPTKQKLIILVHKNQKAFETIDCTCTIPPISDIFGFMCTLVIRLFYYTPLLY